MGWLEFVAEIVKTIAWPLAFIVFVILFKLELSELIASLVRRALHAKWGDKQLDFDAVEVREKAIDARKKAQSLPTLSKEEVEEAVSSLLRKARTRPKTALIDSWESLKTSASAATGGKGPDLDIGIALKDAGVIDEEQLKLFTDLKEVKDKVKFLPEYALDAETAANYAEASSKLEKYISKRTSSPH
ncbi:hypothetical protein [Nitrosococcus wardiae]|uniref:DUF4129 domain-containing protein n=1 Tax=Nitrosococcus wardiae TaxID=1814290 RepID=A0A4P7C3K2_9GAMM|nr:hypothetical protein [Nitrosococcus wardiae]QBQ55506.1 hypothetical protein E3U44_14060 [Nitrosococcus wardiae]